MKEGIRHFGACMLGVGTSEVRQPAYLCSFLICVLSSPSNFSFCAVVLASWTLDHMSSNTSCPSTTAFRTLSISLCSFLAELILSHVIALGHYDAPPAHQNRQQYAYTAWISTPMARNHQQPARRGPKSLSFSSSWSGKRFFELVIK